MKHYSFLLLSLVIIGLSSCKKSTSTSAATAQAAIDDAAIQAYIKTNHITAIKDPSGLYYQIITPGTGPYPTIANNVTVSYTGKLLNGTVFQTASSSYFYLGSNSLIQGWKIGIPYINTGGTILLIIPSGLAYGDVLAGGGNIPANSVLVFTIGLQGFN